ncbi:TPA: RNA 2',3'-cyclic phosphodiesterase [Candidatus Sumerlaeota bacterium]|jgi:RNA 2',3'-cyclic 3'-phosphodiesterase|nr:RNA 2',3'-cyclic phosphodiesterase [Candidatus Sumerlaeota bacterium]
MTMLRTFIAVDMSDAQRSAAVHLQANLQKGIQFTKSYVRWVQPEVMHLTLKFIGDTVEEKVPEIIETVQAALAETHAFSFEMRGLGFFPNVHAPKVLWCGIREGKAELTDLAQRMEETMKTLGYPPEKQPFSPHLTLGRIPAMRGVEAMASVVKSHQETSLGTGLIDAVTLYQSTLTPEGPVYTPLHRWELTTS